MPAHRQGPPLHVHRLEDEEGLIVGTILGRYRGTEWPGCPERCTGAPEPLGPDA